MPIEWNKLRIWDGSQNTAFEKLVCQLAEYEPIPPGSKFVPKGAPDAGVECFWKLPTGQEHGWQAKFFTSSPSSSQWGQLDSSVKTALEKHPALTEYTICLPVDRADARLDGSKSFLDRWDERVAKWIGWAAKESMHVNFRYWGAHEIAERLSRDVHRGRHFFWFQTELFAPVWFQQRLDEAIAAVGPRYTPELNVELTISAVFEGLARSSNFLSQFQEAYGSIGKAWSRGSPRALTEVAPKQVDELCQQLSQIIEIAKSYDRPGIDHIDWSLLKRQAGDALNSALEIDRLTRNAAQKTHDTKLADTKENTQERLRGDSLDYTLHKLRRIQWTLNDFTEFVESDIARLANQPMLLVVGDAGKGKTHLFSDAARNHVEAGAPAVLVLGGSFRNEEPWAQILRMLNLSCNREEFLGALESAAQLCGRRAIIFIDALNESEGRNAWETHLPSMLACLARHPWIALAVSVRSSYEKLVVSDGLVPDKLVRVIHVGFADQEYQAAKAYFDFYGIELPAVPILTPEFQNPLFLRCFCRGLQNRRLTRIPTGIAGISSVFKFFLDSVNEKLAKPNFLDYDPKSNLVGQAIREFASQLSRVGTHGIPRIDAQSVCDRLLPERSFDNSLFRHLLAEGVLAETVWYGDSAQHREMITFSYERLADHLVMRELLSEHVDPDDPAAAFAPGQPLGKYFDDEMACWRNRGLAEALAIQGPEILDKEIFELVPESMDARPVCEAFVESLLWRDPKTTSDKCLQYINEHVMSDEGLNRKLLDVLLTIAPNPEHPFNADFLHKKLMSRGLAQRDAWWSIFLYEEYGQRGAVDRLIDWAWSESERSHISDQSIRLTGKALTWFLTTSQRSLRDRATKALVSLFADRIYVLCEVIPDFAEVNDPYVLERLYAVAYGCALRSNDRDAKRSLAQLVYDLVFKDGTPPCHILLRDYARGVVEVALRDGFALQGFKPALISPPYKSEWPLEIPPKEVVEKYGEWTEGMPDEQWAREMIYGSVMSDGDFARYILGSDGHNLQWSNRRLDEPRVLSRKEHKDIFEASLTARQKAAWDSYMTARHGAEIYLHLGAAQRKEFATETSRDELVEAVNQAERELLRTLGKKKTSIFCDVVLPYLDLSPGEQDEFTLPVSIAQRWVLKRVFDLGWTVEHFGRFDRNCVRYRDSGRSAHKPERIGKKYQWLAYHEFLAHMADNLEFREDTWSDKPNVYVGPWQLWRRDIDPSCLLKSTLRSQWEPNVTAWWSPVCFDAWTEEPDDTRWLKCTNMLPNIAPLPIVIDPETGREWFVLECSYNWEEPTPPERERFDHPRRCVRYFLKSYLVKAEDEPRLYDWGKKKNFMGHRMPESYEQTRVYLGECFWALAFEYFNDPYYHHDGWTAGYESSLPCEVLVTTDMYMQESGGYDCSIDDTIYAFLPAKWIADKMDLSWRGVDGCYFDPAGNLVARDPSVRIRGPAAFLMDKELLSEFLDTEGYRLIWTLHGSKDIRGGLGGGQKWSGCMELSGCMRTNSGRIEGLATAYWADQDSQQTVLAKIDIT